MNMLNVTVIKDIVFEIMLTEPDTSLNNLIAYLAGQGFGRDEIRRAFAEIQEEVGFDE